MVLSIFGTAFDSVLDSVCLPTVFMQLLTNYCGWACRVFKCEISDQLSHLVDTGIVRF